ncbi:hypothetical protein L596_027385 [Steinernema carpocapsae]|uniref:G-protein coupled receptors family 1 profile domain-containing protein n=1 Tax=Steinernema carpocapsae TaxID=34508 RepID=A0A4U5M5J1_STECR|nr:hypothetical protein L596_027385 [Steinernema carpocapsae]
MSELNCLVNAGIFNLQIPERIAIISYRAVIACTLPIFSISILWVLLTQKQFNRFSAYNLIGHILMVDVFHVCTTASAVFFGFYRRDSDSFRMVTALYRFIYFCLLFSLSLLLAINRFLAINELIIAGQIAYNVFALILWIFIGIVIPFLIHFLEKDSESGFDCEFAVYAHYGNDSNYVIQLVEFVLYILILFFYVAIILSVVMKLKQQIKLDSPEVRIALQAFLTFVPQGIAFIFVRIMNTTTPEEGIFTEIFKSGENLIPIHVISDLLPGIYIAVLLTFNRHIRNAVWCLLKRKKKVIVIIVPPMTSARLEIA